MVSVGRVETLSRVPSENHAPSTVTTPPPTGTGDTASEEAAP